MTHPFDMMHAVAGLLVGVLVGLTGVGGGSLMTPLLVLMFGVNPQTAVGTDLLFAAITKIGGSVVHGKRETVDWTIVRRLATGSIPTAIVTLLVLAYVGKIGKSTENVILFSLALLLFVTAVAVASRKWLMRFISQNKPPVPAGKVATGTIILGAVIGLAVSISSVGAGAIGVTVLLVLYPRLQVSRLVGSDIAHAVPLALIAGAGHWIIGDVNLVLLGNLLIGSIPGVIVGSYLSSHAPDKVLQPLLACVLAVSSWQLMIKSQMAEKVNSPIEAVAKEAVH
ncbi:sulfite exporter TauE/SafE family protein [Novosphingobium sp. BL-8H]|uniref:sulfite exporter TauE/SafE family protein n=1 Tax=Novosphingobium sp. BL-8H TaxID=3127640 RepID=UPI00375757D0